MPDDHIYTRHRPPRRDLVDPPLPPAHTDQPLPDDDEQGVAVTLEPEGTIAHVTIAHVTIVPPAGETADD